MTCKPNLETRMISSFNLIWKNSRNFFYIHKWIYLSKKKHLILNLVWEIILTIEINYVILYILNDVGRYNIKIFVIQVWIKKCIFILIMHNYIDYIILILHFILIMYNYIDYMICLKPEQCCTYYSLRYLINHNPNLFVTSVGSNPTFSSFVCFHPSISNFFFL